MQPNFIYFLNIEQKSANFLCKGAVSNVGFAGHILSLSDILYIFLQPFKNVKPFLAHKPHKKNTAGHYLPTPALENCR